MRSWTRIAVGCLAVAILLFGGVARVEAALITVVATDCGWYHEAGYHDPTNNNYEAGWDGDEYQLELRNFFVFTIPAISGTITGISLIAYNPAVGEFGGDGGYESPDATETFTATEVTTSVITLVTGGSGLIGIYDDLGDGAYAGASVVVSDAYDGAYVTMNLTAAAADILAAQNSDFAVGGYLTGLSKPMNVDERIFGWTNDVGGDPPTGQPWPRLEITTSDGPGPDPAIPEPTTLALLGGALVALARRRRK